METKKVNLSKPANFEVPYVYEDSFHMERLNIPSPIPSQNYHYHDCYELYYLYSGERYYFITDTTYHIEGGSFVLINPHDIHCTANFAHHGYDRLLINFRKEYLDSFLRPEKSDHALTCFKENIHIITLNPKERHFAEVLLENMLEEYNTASIEESSYLRAALSSLLLFLCKRRPGKADTLPRYANSTHKVISEVTGYINTHYSEDITLESLSSLFYISPCYFSRTFKKVCGLSFTEYLNNVRIKEAQKLLLTKGTTVKEVTEKTGFKSNAHFDRVFKAIVGASPLQYKKSAKG